MSLRQRIPRSVSRGPSAAAAAGRAAFKSAAQVLLHQKAFGKKENAPAKSPDAFPWEEFADASTSDGSDVMSWTSVDLMSWTSGNSLASKPVCSQPCTQGEPVLLFDWDDTLLPSSFLDFLGSLPASGRQYEAAGQHSQRVQSILRAARALGRVAIVTMANKRWVVQSAERYLPGLDIEALCEELDIPLVYASEYTTRFATLPAFEAAVACKSAAIARCLEDLGAVEASVRKPMNIVSIGDSRIEHTALRSVMTTWGETGRLAREPLVKTVKLMDNPTMTQLGMELRMLEGCLSGIIETTSGFSLAATSTSEFQEVVWERFARRSNGHTDSL